MTLHIKPCPICKSTQVSALQSDYRGFHVVCMNGVCPTRGKTVYGSSGMSMNDIQKLAIEEWNKVAR